MGLGPMPAPNGRDYAVAQMNAALDSGIFDPSQLGPQYIQAQYNQMAQHQAPKEVLNLDVHVPCRAAGKNEAPVTKILTFDIKGTIPNDFLDRVCATMGQARDTARLVGKHVMQRKRPRRMLWMLPTSSRPGRRTRDYSGARGGRELSIPKRHCRPTLEFLFYSRAPSASAFSARWS
ncbi:hypothetical protein B0H14DRAFT_2573880 [Mycena olivaceomarginata]|nr:hypothetical protein B0H14DRAFT_2573880 [Mycena olivaceomarginata]